MVGRMDDFLALLERAHHGVPGRRRGASRRALRVLDRDDPRDSRRDRAGGRMVRSCAAPGRARGARLRRAGLSAHAGRAPAPSERETSRRRTTPLADAAEIGERFGDADLFAAAVQFQGLIRIKQGRVEEGLGLLDEAMVAVTAGEVSPVMSGVVYCGVIACCEEAFEPRRAREWTNALARWCEGQPQMVAFTRPLPRAPRRDHAAARRVARCARRGAAGARALRAGDEPGGDRPGALPARGAPSPARGLRSGRGGVPRREPLRAGSRSPAWRCCGSARETSTPAAAAIRRVVGETTEPLPACRAPARLRGDHARGRRRRGGAQRLRASSGRSRRRAGARCCDAIAAQRRGAVELAEGDAQAALASLRHAWQVWQELEAPYEVARVRVLVGLACRALGDEDSAALELDAARASSSELGAAPDLARVELARSERGARDTHGLSAARARGAAPGRGREDEPRDRRGARRQRAHRRAARAEHLRQARRVVANRGDGVRVRARPGLTPRVVRNDHAPLARSWSDPRDAGRHAAS